MARNALEELCRIYWRPVFVFVCRRGYLTEDARDFTQDFFVKILGPNWLEHADVNRGRFRTLLLTSLQNFLAGPRMWESVCRLWLHDLAAFARRAGLDRK